MNLVKLNSPSFVLNFPSSFDTTNRNNVWMETMSEEDIQVDKEGALAQWTDLYNIISANGLVTVLPTPADCKLQDLVFVANLGIVVDEDTIIISNYTSEPRLGEAQVGLDYFKLAGFKNVVQCPYKFEGEADLKHIRDNIYIGGYGIRTDIRAYEWMEENFDMYIIKVEMKSPKLYHFDCLCFPLTKNTILLCESECADYELEEIKQNGIEIIDVPLKYAECGVTNNVRLHNYVLNSSDFYDLDPELDGEDYVLEREKNQWLEDTLADYGMEPVFVNLSEFTKGGAMLSCCVMHMNRFSYNVELV